MIILDWTNIKILVIHSTEYKVFDALKKVPEACNLVANVESNCKL